VSQAPLRLRGRHPGRSDTPPTQVLYANALLARDALLVVFLVVTLALPGEGTRHVLAAAVIGLVVLPYNRLLQVRLARTGHVPSYLSWADQVIAASFTLAWPELFAPVMVVAIFDVALAAVMV
jgi:hypothetical protein